MLELENVEKTFRHNGNEIQVLRGIDLIIEKGMSIAITGASGVGKSTLLNIMGTLESPTGGAVRFERQDVGRMGEAELCRLRNRDIGFVFQFHHLLPEFNALENTIMPVLIARMQKARAMDMAAEILGRVGLEDRLRHRIGELSGGEQQRVAIARALIMKPKLLLADEPTGNLDTVTGEGIGTLLVRLNREEGLAMVIATHNQQLAEKMACRMDLRDGRLHSREEGEDHAGNL
ncbi:MAG: ABC transporter ATP-binding protein [Deltaproteobacteria bacterium]|nr:ABC transporter ATP-binding protein [Deltaproteobacteria bacterium]